MLSEGQQIYLPWSKTRYTLERITDTRQGKTTTRKYFFGTFQITEADLKTSIRRKRIIIEPVKTPYQ